MSNFFTILHEKISRLEVVSINDIFIKEVALPTKIKSFVVALPDGDYDIFLNSNLNFETRMDAYNHEIDHIERGDYEKKCDVDMIEINAHGSMQ